MMRQIVFSIFLTLFFSSNLIGQDIPINQIPIDSIWKNVALNEVVVTAQYAPTNTKNAIQNIRIIHRSTIDRQGVNNLEQLLQQDLSIRIQQDLVLGSSMQLLGSEGEHIKIMIDGVPVIGRLNGNIDLSQINLNNVERVEIIEGPMSVAYGTDALGGVINLITKKNQLHPFEVTLNQQLETRNESSIVANAGLRLSNNLLIRTNFGRDNFKGFGQDTLRSSLWNPKKQKYGDVSLRYDFNNDNRLIYKFSLFNEEVQDLGDIRRLVFEPYAFDNLYQTQRIDHSLNHKGTIFKHWYVQNTIGYNQFNRKIFNQRTAIELDSTWILSSDTTQFEALMLRSVLASDNKKSKLNVQVGIDLRYETGEGDRIYDKSNKPTNASNIGDYSIFGNIRYQVSKNLATDLGLRMAHNTRYNAPLIPSFNLKYKLTDSWTLRTSYAKGFRSPSLKELYTSFIDVNHFIIGNPNLSAETSHNFQANVKYQKNWNRHHLQISSHFFYNDIQDQIGLYTYLEDSDGRFEPVSPDQSSQYAYFNIENAKIGGINIRSSYQWKDLTLEAGLSKLYQYNPLSEDYIEVIPFTPSNEINGKLIYRLPLIHTDLSVFYRKNDRLVTYYPTVNQAGENITAQRIIDGFSIMDATLFRSFLNKRLEITTGVRNIFDIQQVNITGGSGVAHSSGNNLPIGTGRSYFVRVGFRLFDNASAKMVNTTIEHQQKEALNIRPTQDALYASWIENNYDEEPIFQFSKYQNDTWSRPKTIAIGNKKWFVNDIDSPVFADFKENKKHLMAVWLEKSNHRNSYDHHLKVSHSNNGGKNWKKPYKPYKSEKPAFFGLSRIAHINKNKNLLIWMDGRDTKEKLTNGHYFPVRNSKLLLRSTEISKMGKTTNEQALPVEVAQLCAFDVNETSNGIMLVYRNIDYQIKTTTYLNGRWAIPTFISSDKWSSRSLIVDAPAIDYKNEQAVIAWYSEANKQKLIKIAFSKKQEGYDITCITNPNIIGKPDILWLDSTKALLCFVEEKNEKQFLILTILQKDGTILSQKRVSSSNKSKLVAPPQLNKLDSQIFLSFKWEQTLDYHIKVVTIFDDYTININ